MYHIPVMLNESIEGLNIKPEGTYVDATFGGGGHSREILRRLDNGRLFAFDQDSDAFENIPDDDRFVLIKTNFRFLKNFLRLHDALPVDGILADLGISSHQIDVAERGFSSRFDAPLDMRMDREQELTAAQIINEYDERQLTGLFRKYGEIKNSGSVSKAVIRARETGKIQTTFQLAEAVRSCFPPSKFNKSLARLFQALRIEVNDELAALEEFLLQTPDVLKKGGRLVVIAYHSLEDRLVKNFMRSGNLEGKVEKDFYGNPILTFKVITGKPIVPSEGEIKLNNRARSAKLRIAEKILNDAE
ncbi:MAG: 16S rRNA (cytosine(1402)-N(4))-methyltransferase RsmH [Chlorobi bacterium]|nr:16S rRNA (cytosine(1402)-N(4))-methyltransferase RsmH [Chlorobiota bacterium]